MKIGDKITFIPHAWLGEASARSGKWGTIPVRVQGTVEYINKAHRMFRVRYDTPAGPAYECFKITN